MGNSKLYQWSVEHRHPIFLVGLLLFFIVPEVFEKIFLFPLPPQLIFILLVVSSMLLIRVAAKYRFIPYAIVLGLVAFIIYWNTLSESNSIELTAYVFLFIYFSFIAFFLFKDLMNSQKITPSVIIGAFAGYFMIGVIFFFIFSLLDLAYPDTVNVDMNVHKGIDDMFYFSFITLTTIGYGDFSPTSSMGQKLAILEGLIGQFYIAIVMAILVGKFLSREPD